MADDATARNIVDLAMDDKPNAAGDVLNDIMLDKIGTQVQGIKNDISNDMFGNVPVEAEEGDADMVETQPELDLEPNEEERETYEADQETIEEPADQVEGDVDVDVEQTEESEEEKEE